jgi:hypothetical protein
MTAEIIDFIDIWRAKRGLSRAEAELQMKIAQGDKTQPETVDLLDDTRPPQSRNRWWIE